MRRNRLLLLAVAVAVFFISSPGWPTLMDLTPISIHFRKSLRTTPPAMAAPTLRLIPSPAFSRSRGSGLYADLLAGATTVRLQDAAVGANGPTIGLLNLDTPGNTSGTFSGSVTDVDRGANHGLRCRQHLLEHCRFSVPQRRDPRSASRRDSRAGQHRVGRHAVGPGRICSPSHAGRRLSRSRRAIALPRLAYASPSPEFMPSCRILR